jgi:hypothetical protein
MKPGHILKLLTLCIAITLVTQIQSQEKSTIGPYNTVYTPYKQGTIWSGQRKDTLMPSKVLGYSKNISIFTPDKYKEFPEKCPLIILFDRQSIGNTDYILHAIQYMIDYGQIPRSVIVAIESGRELNQRSSEARWGADGRGGFGEKVDEFIFDELIPFMGNNYSIDMNQMIAYGHSWFGYHSTMLLTKRIPQLFGVISGSPCCLSSERIDDIIKGIKTDAPALNRKFYYRVASGHSIGDDIGVYDELTGKIAQLSLPPNFDYKTTRFVGAMHMEVPGLLFIRSLYEIYESWAELAFSYADPRKYPTYDDARLCDSLQILSDKIYGFRIPIYDRHMEMRIEYNRYVKDEKVGNMGRIATWKFMISKYGERPEWCYGIADCYQKLGNINDATIYFNKTKAIK